MFKRKLPSSRKGGSGKNESGILAARRLLRRRLRIEQLESRQLLAYSMFLNIPGIDGSAVGAGAGPTDMKLESFQWSLARDSVNTPLTVGELVFEKGIDSATPKLIKDALIGPVYDSKATVLRVTNDVGGAFGVDQLRLDLTNARLTSFAAAESINESASLSFSKVSFTETLPDPLTGNPSSSSRVASLNLLNGTTTKSSLSNANGPITTQTVLTIDGVDLIIDSFNWNLDGAKGTTTSDSPFSFSRSVDRATAGLLGSIMAGTTHSKMTLTDRRTLSDGTFQTYMTWNLNNAFISTFDLGVDENGPRNSFSVKYSGLDVTYTPSKLANVQIPEYANPVKLTLTRSKNGDLSSSDNNLPISGSSPSEQPGHIKFVDGSVAYDELDWSLARVESSGLESPIKTFGGLRLSMPISSAAPRLISDAITLLIKNEVAINTSSSVSDDFWKLKQVVVTDCYISSSIGEEPRIVLELVFDEMVMTQIAAETGQTPIRSVTTQYNQLTKVGSIIGPLFNDPIDSPPDLIMVVAENGRTFELPVSLASWDAHRDSTLQPATGYSFDAPELGDFSITFNRGLHSPQFFLDAAMGNKIDNIKLIRYLPGKSGDPNSLQYQYEFENTLISRYATNAFANLTKIGQDTISLAPQIIRLTTVTRDLANASTGTTTTTLNLQDNTATITGIDDTAGLVFEEASSGQPLNEFPRLVLPGNTVSPVDFYTTGTFTDVTLLPNGKRVLDSPEQNAIRFNADRNPSATFLHKLFSSKAYEFSGDNSLKLQGDDNRLTPQQATSTLSSSGLVTPTNFSYSDGANDFKAGMEFGFYPTKAELQQKQIANKVATNGSSVSWNFGKPGATLDNSALNSSEFPGDSVPETVLKFVSGNDILELELETFSWSASNSVFQEVGTVKAPKVLAPRQGANQVNFAISAKMDAAAPNFLNALLNRTSIPTLTIFQRANFRINGEIENRVYREWELENSFVQELFTLVDDSGASGFVDLRLNVGKLTSTFAEFLEDSFAPSFGSLGAIGLASAQLAATDPVATFTDSVDFVTPPVALGIGNFITSSQTTRTISLPTVFSDEQEAANTLIYTFTVLDNPGLFDSVSIDTSKNLILDFKNGASGIARISVSAMDSFGLIGTDIFQVGTDVTLDFGDAPAPYPTLIAPNGAGHVAIGPRLGALRDTEPTGQPNANATGDGADEDGVMFGQIIAGRTLAGVNVTLQNATAARVDAWIDFNRDGDFDDEGEKILDSIALIAGLQTLNYNIPTGATAGNTFARVRVSSAGGLAPTGLAVDGEVEDYAVTVRSAATVVNQKIFYNRSFFDGSTFSNGNVATDGANDAAAIDNSKTPLLPGATATQANYTSYSRGINGIFIDVQNLPGPITAADFTFRVGNSNTPNSWAVAPAPASITVLPGAGLNGSDRIRITWADNVIQKTWLQVTLKGTSNTGLLSDNIHYWGNAVGETGDSTANAQVTLADVAIVRASQTGFGFAAITDLRDINKDRRINLEDVALARSNQSGFTPLRLITTPT